MNEDTTLVQPVDLDRLAEQTGGDRKLAREVLLLFIDDAPIQIHRLKAAGPADRRAIAHRLLGSARAIGAAEVARQAARFETGDGDMPALAAAVEAARTFILARLAVPE